MKMNKEAPYILAIDTAGKSCSVAIAKGEMLLGEAFLQNGFTHSTTLLPLIDGCLSQVGLEVSQMNALALTNGPGSFTGLRIGMSTIKGFAEVLQAPIVTLSTLYALAAPFSYFEGIVCALIDARSQRVYCGIYEKGVLLQQEDVIEIKALQKHIGNREKILFVGDGAEGYQEMLTAAFPCAVFAERIYASPHIGASIPYINAALAKGDTEDCFSAKLQYIVASQAEQNKQKEAEQHADS